MTSNELLTELQRQGIRDRDVLKAMTEVDRKHFVPRAHADKAYLNQPLPIGFEQTISQPYIVAYVTEKLELETSDRVLEIGTGSGYQAAILSKLCQDVCSLEIREDLLEGARQRFSSLGLNNIRTKLSDGHSGWKEFAPFDKILLNAAASHVPPDLIRQLKVGGIMILPFGEDHQNLILLRKHKDRIQEKILLPVRYVPLTAESPQIV